MKTRKRKGNSLKKIITSFYFLIPIILFILVSTFLLTETENIHKKHQQQQQQQLLEQQQLSKLNLKIGIITFASTDRLNQYNLGIQSKRCYSLKHGYDFILETSSFVDNPYSDYYKEKRKPHWNKVKAIEKYLNYFDWVVWMDADVIIVNYQKKLEDFINLMYKDDKEEKEDFSLIFTDHPNTINNGVFFIRNSEYGFNFLKEWWELGTPIENELLKNDETKKKGKKRWFWIDNGPLIEMLLRTTKNSLSTNVKYNQECSNPDISGIDTLFVECTDKWFQTLNSTYRRRKHDNIYFVDPLLYRGFNSRISYRQREIQKWPNETQYQQGDLLLHFAGQMQNGKNTMSKIANPRLISTCDLDSFTIGTLESWEKWLP